MNILDKISDYPMLIFAIAIIAFFVIAIIALAGEYALKIVSALGHCR